MLPPENQVNKIFIQKLYKGEKQILKMENVRFINVPKYDELSVTNMLKLVKNDTELLKFWPDEYIAGMQPSRQFFFNTINTVYPGFLKQLITNSNQQRCGVSDEQNKKSSILVNDEWLNNLSSIPFHSKVSRICFFIN